MHLGVGLCSTIADVTTVPSTSRGLTLLGPAKRPVPVRVLDYGSGPPIVFLHGLVGLNEHWEDVVAGVQSKLRCTMLEVPLLELEGDDCCIQGVTELTSRFLAEHIIPNHGPPIIAGNSFGGHVALRLAIEHPKMVRALVLAGSSGLIEKSMVSDIQIRPSREWLARKIGELFCDQSKMREADLDRAFNALQARGGARAMVRLSRSARKNHLGSQLSTIKCPALLVWGRQDIVTPPEAAEGFLKLLPDSQIVWFDQCGHVPMVECSEQFSTSLLAFAESLTARGL